MLRKHGRESENVEHSRGLDSGGFVQCNTFHSPDLRPTPEKAMVSFNKKFMAI